MDAQESPVEPLPVPSGLKSPIEQVGASDAHGTDECCYLRHEDFGPRSSQLLGKGVSLLTCELGGRPREVCESEMADSGRIEVGKLFRRNRLVPVVSAKIRIPERRTKQCGRGRVQEHLGEVLATDDEYIVDTEVCWQWIVFGRSVWTFPLDRAGSAPPESLVGLEEVSAVFKRIGELLDVLALEPPLLE